MSDSEAFSATNNDDQDDRNEFIDEDVAKARALVSSLTIYDRILQSRVALQKALDLSNRIVESSAAGITSDTGTENNIAETRQSLQKFTDSITNIRSELLHGWIDDEEESDFSAAASPHGKLESMEKLAQPWRERTLLLLSQKTTHAHVQQLKSFTNIDIISQLKGSITGESLAKLVAKSKQPKAPGEIEGEHVFYDSTFFQSIIKELVERKLDKALDPTYQELINRPSVKNKTKSIDTKASKGRKLRYTVHEKLQNFMAPESFPKWSSEQIDSLFGGLLGQHVQLYSDEESDDSVSDIVATENDIRII